MKIKLGTVDKRQIAFCEYIKRNKDGVPVVVEWYKSSTWGNCPKLVDNRGDKVHSVTGCGFDKLSTVLADTLRWLAVENPYAIKDADLYPKSFYSIGGKGGAGVSSVITQLEQVGWKLKHQLDSKAIDVFSIEKL